MTKIKVDEKGLNGRPVNPYPELMHNLVGGSCGNYNYEQFEKTVKSHSLTEPAEPNLVCEGNLNWYYREIGHDKWNCIDESQINDYDLTFNQVEQAWQIVKPMQEAAEIKDKAQTQNKRLQEMLNDLQLNEVAEKYAYQFTDGLEPDFLLLKNAFIAGATRQAPITKAETIHDIAEIVIGLSRRIDDDVVDDLLSQINNI